MKNQKAIYIIGGGPLGINILIWAKEFGLTTIVTDKSKDAPGLKIADITFVADAADFRSHLSFAKSLCDRFKIVGIYCGNEIGVWTIYHLSKFLDLGHNSSEALQNVLDKAKMKRLWEKEKIPSPKANIVKNSKKIKEIIGDSESEFIIKPAKGSGSRGVQIINKKSDYHKVFESCIEAVEKAGDVILEEYVSGRSIDANGIFLQGRFYPAGILEKYITDFPHCLPIAGNDPADISEDEQKQVYELLEKASRALGLTFGPVKADFIRTDTGYQVLEVAPRFHGDVTTCNTLPFGSEIDPVKFYFHYLLTGELKSEFLDLNHRNYATWRVVCLPPGELREKLPAGSQCSGPEQITKVWYNRRCSHLIERYSDTSKVPGYICAYGENQQETENMLAQFFDRQEYKIDVNKEHLAWYEQLGARIEEIGLSKKSCCFGDFT